MATLYPLQSVPYPVGTISILLTSIGGDPGMYEVQYQNGNTIDGTIPADGKEFVQTEFRLSFDLVNTGQYAFAY
jgi:hypothetical protein